MPVNTDKYLLRNCLAVLLGIVIYLPALFGGFNTDEHLSFYLAKLPIGEIVQTTSHAHNTPPPYYIILHWWLNLVPEQPEYLRLFDLVFVALSGVTLIRLIKRLGYPQYGAVCCIFLFYNFFFFRDLFTNLRPYPICVWLSLLSLDSLYRYCSSRSWRDLIFYTLVLACGYQFHMTFLMVIPIHLVIGYYLSSQIVPLLVANALAAATSLFWYSQLFRLVTQSKDLDMWVFTDGTTSIYYLIIYPALLVLGAILIVLLPSVLNRKLPRYKVGAVGQGLLSAFCVVSLLISTLIFSTDGPPLALRYYFHFHVLGVLIFSYLLVNSRQRYLQLLLLVTFLVPEYWVINQFGYWRGNWSMLAEQIEEKNAPVFVFSQLIELRSNRWLNDLTRTKLLAAPVTNFTTLKNVQVIPWGPFDEFKTGFISNSCRSIAPGSPVYVTGAIAGTFGNFSFKSNIDEFMRTCGLEPIQWHPSPTQIAVISAVKK